MQGGYAGKMLFVNITSRGKNLIWNAFRLN